MLEKLWPLLLIAIAIIIFKEYTKKTTKRVSRNKPNLSVYEKKTYLFDTNAEFNLYKILLEIFGNEYFIFPQINYGHLIQPKKTTWQEERRHRSRIDRKSADFVLCDKEKIVPKLVIEQDGSVHNFKSRQARDKFINQLMKVVDLPILHLRTGNVDREFIEKEVRQKLSH